MPHVQSSQPQSRDHPFAEGILDGIQQIAFIDATHCFVEICERLLEEFQDIRFGFDRIWAALAAHIDRWFFSKDGGPEYVVDRCNVLHLLSEGAHTFE